MPATDEYAGLIAGVDSPVRKGVAVSPHDTNELGFVSRSLFIGGAGNVAVLFADDSSPVTLVGCQAGQLLPVRVRKVLSTGTTATNIVALA